MMRSRQLICPAALVAAFVLVVGLGGGAGTASAAKVTTTLVWPQAWASRIVIPRGGAVVTDGTVRVTAQLAPGVRSFRAWVGNARVTSAYRASGRLRDATLRVGRTPGLGYGRRILYVETLGRRGQEWWAESHIVLARPGKGVLLRGFRASCSGRRRGRQRDDGERKQQGESADRQRTATVAAGPGRSSFVASQRGRWPASRA